MLSLFVIVRQVAVSHSLSLAIRNHFKQTIHQPTTCYTKQTRSFTYKSEDHAIPTFFFSELVHLPCMEHVVSSRQHSCFPHPSRARTSTRTRTTKVRRSARRCTAYPLAAELVVLVVAEPPLLLNDCMFLTVVVSSIVSHDYGQAMNRPKLWPLL
mmetsp:Transcript_4724/g.12375  ORF Transcript_4724/g.12375 Transcript_4724/m.12375 type:complete len:155 (+) Transcript_4724:576-1040(+)